MRTYPGKGEKAGACQPCTTYASDGEREDGGCTWRDKRGAKLLPNTSVRALCELGVDERGNVKRNLFSQLRREIQQGEKGTGGRT